MRKVKLIINKETDMLKNQDVSVIETEIVWVFFLAKAFHYYASLESTDRPPCAGGTDVGPQRSHRGEGSTAIVWVTASEASNSSIRPKACVRSPTCQGRIPRSSQSSYAKDMFQFKKVNFKKLPSSSLISSLTH